MHREIPCKASNLQLVALYAPQKQQCSARKRRAAVCGIEPRVSNNLRAKRARCLTPVRLSVWRRPKRCCSTLSVMLRWLLATPEHHGASALRDHSLSLAQGAQVARCATMGAGSRVQAVPKLGAICLAAR